MEPIAAANKNPLDQIADNKKRYDDLKNNSSREYRYNIVKTALAILGGLTVTALCATLSIKLITGKNITTQFVGLGSLIITVPVGISVPIIIGVKVAKKKDWTRYHDENVAKQKCIEILTCNLEHLSKVNLKFYGKCGILNPRDAKKITETFVATYQENKKILDTATKKDPVYVECLKHSGVKDYLDYTPAQIAINTVWLQVTRLETEWKQFQDPDYKKFPAVNFSSKLPHLLPFGIIVPHPRSLASEAN